MKRLSCFLMETIVLWWRCDEVLQRWPLLQYLFKWFCWLVRYQLTGSYYLFFHCITSFPLRFFEFWIWILWFFCIVVRIKYWHVLAMLQLQTGHIGNVKIAGFISLPLPRFIVLTNRTIADWSYKSESFSTRLLVPKWFVRTDGFIVAGISFDSSPCSCLLLFHSMTDVPVHKSRLMQVPTQQAGMICLLARIIQTLQPRYCCGLEPFR